MNREDILRAGYEGAAFRTGTHVVDGVTIGYRIGGTGPAVLLIHGFPKSGRTWSEVARQLVDTHTVIVPDYRGACGSDRPTEGYTKRRMAADLHSLVRALGHDRAHVVGQDIGAMIAAHHAFQHPDATQTLTYIEATLPGTEANAKIVASGNVWHFGLHQDVPFASKLIAGEPELYLDHFLGGLAGEGGGPSREERAFYLRCYGTADEIAGAIRPYAAFEKDATDLKASLQNGKLTMPSLFVGGKKSLARFMDPTGREIAENPHVATIDGTGHFVQEEQPERLVELLLEHFARDGTSR